MNAQSALSAPSEPLRPLTDRQRKFAQYYAELENASEAARKAGYAAKGASTVGSMLRKLPHVAAAIARAREANRKPSLHQTRAGLVDRLWSEATDSERKGSTTTSRVAALKLLGQELYGMFQPQSRDQSSLRPIQAIQFNLQVNAANSSAETEIELRQPVPKRIEG